MITLPALTQQSLCMADQFTRAIILELSRCDICAFTITEYMEYIHGAVLHLNSAIICAESTLDIRADLMLFISPACSGQRLIVLSTD